MNETLYSWTFKFHKVVRQQNSGVVEDFILPYSAAYLRIQKWKNYRNRSTFAKVIAKIKVARFFMAHGVEGFWGPEICLECVGGRGFAPDPAGGAHDAPLDPLVGWGGGHPLQGTPLPRTPRLSAPRSSRFQRSALAARRHVSSVYTHLNFWQYATNWFYSNFA